MRVGCVTGAADGDTPSGGIACRRLGLEEGAESRKRFRLSLEEGRIMEAECVANATENVWIDEGPLRVPRTTACARRSRALRCLEHPEGREVDAAGDENRNDFGNRVSRAVGRLVNAVCRLGQQAGWPASQNKLVGLSVGRQNEERLSAETRAELRQSEGGYDLTSPWSWRAGGSAVAPVWTRTWREGEMTDERVVGRAEGDGRADFEL
jgi:hypothetical protein